MQTRVGNHLCGVILLALILGAVAPASAGETYVRELEFRIELDEILAVDDGGIASDGLFAVESTSTEPVLIAEAAALPVRSPRRSAQILQDQDTSPAQSTSKKGRTGRWLKKHWWVPVIVGVAVGVVLLEPFDDDADDKREAMMAAQ